MYASSPWTRTKVNGVVPGVVMLIGAMLTGFGATKQWVDGAISIFRLRLHKAFTFDSVYLTDGSKENFKSLLLGCAVITALAGVALVATTITGLGVAWRVFGLLATAVTGVIAYVVWNSVDHPDQVIAGLIGGGDPGRIASGATKFGIAFNVASVSAGHGLWLITIGTAVSLIGGIIPAAKRSLPPTPPTPWPPYYGPTPWPGGTHWR